MSEINNKIFDPDQVQEILGELTNQLDSLVDKMKSDDSWATDQLARNLFTNRLKFEDKRRQIGVFFVRVRLIDPGGTRL